MRNPLPILVPALALALTPPAMAHVVVGPAEATAGTTVTFDMRVPSSRIRATGSPASPRADACSRSSSSASTSVRGCRRRPTTVTWKVIQTYKGGKVVRYTGEPGEESASQTTVVAAP